MSAPDLSPDLGRLGDDLTRLSGYRDPSAPGWTRRVFSPQDVEARSFVAEAMAEAGLEVEVDACANVIGRLPGTGGLPDALVTGSHTDTVQGGGRFDGIIGVLGAIEAVRLLSERSVRLAHDLVVVDFLGEEPNDFGLSCVGSRAIAGNLGPEHLALVDPTGRPLSAAIESVGGDTSRIGEACWRPERVRCYVELHIEQGPRLEDAGVPIGVVTGIVGIHRLLASFAGQADHAGTMPMPRRRDALTGAAELVLEVERQAASSKAPGAVATAGRIEVLPGAQNVVPSEARLWAEARSADDAWLASFGEEMESAAAAIGARRGLESSLEWLSREEGVRATGWVSETVASAAASLGLGTLVLPSGAGHDAAQMARLGPMGMLFVPSREGRSHCPEEWTELGQIGAGVAVLAETLRSADASGPRP